MKVLHLNVTDFKTGSGRAAYRLHQGLREHGVASEMLVQTKRSEDSSVLGPDTLFAKGMGAVRSIVDSLPLELYPERQAPLFSLQWLPDVVTMRLRRLNPDLIHLHWICKAYVAIATVRHLPGPLVWTMHDVWPFTGGCHLNFDCHRYRDLCGACPELKSKRERDLSHWVWRRKLRNWQGLDLTLVAPSTWLASVAQSSSLFKNSRIEVIPHGLDLATFKPTEQNAARSKLDLPMDRQLVLFASAARPDRRHKGFGLLTDALQRLRAAGWGTRCELLIAGPAARLPEPVGIHTRYVGHVHDDLSLSWLYSAADVTVVPSLQESFGQVAMESLACGTPAVAFDATGLRDIIAHQQDGYLAQPFSVEDLSHGIAWTLTGDERRLSLGADGRRKAEREYDQNLQAQRYLTLYEELLQSSGRRRP